MPGYITQFTKLTSEEQKQQLENKVRSTQHLISINPVFAKSVDHHTKTDPSEWGTEHYVVTGWTIDEAKTEVRAIVAYHAYRNVLFDLDDSATGNHFNGRIAAVIDDEGKLRYESTSTTTPTPLKALESRGVNVRHGSRNGLPIGAKALAGLKQKPAAELGMPESENTIWRSSNSIPAGNSTSSPTRLARCSIMVRSTRARRT